MTQARRVGVSAAEFEALFQAVSNWGRWGEDDERGTLLLFAWEDLPYQSIAEALELPIGTVRSRLNRARARLRELLEPKGKDKVRSR